MPSLNHLFYRVKESSRPLRSTSLDLAAIYYDSLINCWLCLQVSPTWGNTGKPPMMVDGENPEKNIIYNHTIMLAAALQIYYTTRSVIYLCSQDAYLFMRAINHGVHPKPWEITCVVAVIISVLPLLHKSLNVTQTAAH